jgi:hypothetical protein
VVKFLDGARSRGGVGVVFRGSELHSTSLQLIMDKGEAEGVGVELPTMRWLPQWTAASGFASPVTGKGN